MATRTLESALNLAVADSVIRRDLGGKIPGLETKYTKLDAILNGLRPDSMLVIGARTGMGKTSLALNIAKNLSDQDHAGIYFSLEMEAKLLAYRLLAQQTGVPVMRLERGEFSEQEYETIQRGSQSLANLPLMICDDVLDTYGVQAITKGIIEKSARGKLDYLVIDYCTLLTDDNHLDQYNRITRISQRVRNLAREFYLPIIMLVQLNREADKRESKEPTITDIRDSGAIEQDAFSVVLCHRPAYYQMDADYVAEEQDSSLIIAKNRQGPTGKIHVPFRPEFMSWVSEDRAPTRPQSVR